MHDNENQQELHQRFRDVQRRRWHELDVAYEGYAKIVRNTVGAKDRKNIWKRTRRSQDPLPFSAIVIINSRIIEGTAAHTEGPSLLLFERLQ